MKQILSFVVLILFGAVSAAFANPLPQETLATDSLAKPAEVQCGWYVIFLCSRDQADAQNAVDREGNGSVVIDSSNPDFYSFRRGWYCAAFGPSDRAVALKQHATVRRRYPTAYPKKSC
jgi:hypothetical protein